MKKVVMIISVLFLGLISGVSLDRESILNKSIALTACGVDEWTFR